MSEQIWKYLPHVPTTNKQSNVFKRKSEVTDKQVLNLTGGLFPLKLVKAADFKNSPQNLDHWVYTPIIQRNPKIGPIHHWVKQHQEKKIYHGDKFNVEPQIIQFTPQQFNQIANKYPNYTFNQVTNLFSLLRNYNMNFIVAHDRLDSNNRTIQDLKEIYFSVTREVMLLRGQKDHPLINYIFDKKYQNNRKNQLQKFMMRSKINNDQERYLINQIRRLEILIKKQEREQINLKKALKLDEIPQQNFDVSNAQQCVEELRKSQKVYSRQQYLSKPLQLPGKIYQRLVEVLNGMNIPDKIIATAENQQLYDKLRKKILLMFSVQRYIRKKENQRRILEDKKKKLVLTQDDEDKRKNIASVDSLPKKKHTLINDPFNELTIIIIIFYQNSHSNLIIFSLKITLFADIYASNRQFGF